MREKEKGFVKSYWSGFFRAALVFLLVMIQVAFIIALTLWLTSYTVYIYLIIEVASIIVAIGLLNDSRSQSYKLSWICIILLLPVTGHIMYLLWGKAGSTKKIEQQIVSKMRHGESFYEYDEEAIARFEARYPTKSRMVRYLKSHSFPLFKNNQVAYYPMGEDAFEAIFADLEQAKRFILMEFFIVGDGVLWQRMDELLKRKAAQGVEIMFLYDDFGAMFRTDKHFKQNLESEGIQVRTFNPVHRYTDKLYMNYRTHQKIVVVDGNVGFTGGINLADEYVNLVERFGVWKDNAVRVEGDAVWGLTVTFLQLWEASARAPLVDYTKYKPNKAFEQNESYCQVISDGPANNPRNPAAGIYKQIINYSKRYLYITTPYLVLEDDMQDALVSAVRSGIDVRIITPKIPDKKSVNLITTYNYGALLEGGVRIFEYTPGFIHAKTIINEDCGVVGTINMDFRSFYLHYECGLFMCDPSVVAHIREDLEATMAISEEITLEVWKKRPWHIRLYQRVLIMFATLM